MKITLGFLFALLLYSPVSAQDLPPDILADMYLLEATKALEDGDAQGAIRAFGKIEALDTETPPEFAYFYGKSLVENGATFNDLLKGQRLLKSYVIRIEKDSEHYTPTLELLSIVRAELEEAETERQRRAKLQAETERRAETERKRRAKAKRQVEKRLFDAIEAGKAEQVETFLADGIDVHARDDYGNTPLHKIARYSGGHWDGSKARTVTFEEALEVAKVLLGTGADIHTKNKHGGTPLHTLCDNSRPNPKIGKLFLAAGADIHAKDNVGQTPLHYIVVYRSSESAKILKILLDAGANMNVKNNYGYTPLHEASGAVHKIAGTIVSALESVKVLLAAGADVHTKDSHGRTPLHHAASQGLPDVVHVLLAAGTDINAKDNDGQTPLGANVSRARNPNNVHRGLTEAAEVLRAAGARH